MVSIPSIPDTKPKNSRLHLERVPRLVNGKTEPARRIAFLDNPMGGDLEIFPNRQHEYERTYMTRKANLYRITPSPQ